MKRTFAFLLLLACCLCNETTAQITTPTRPATAPQLPGLSAGGGSHTPVISPNGRYVVFVSQANNLVTNDNQAPHLDVFVRDLLNGTTSLVSVNRTGTGGGDKDSNYPDIAFEEKIAFESAASNLVENDTNGVSDIFIRNLASNTTSLASVSFDGTSPGNGPSFDPMFTGKGDMVVFASEASNLVADDTNGICDVFVRRLWSETNILVSVGANSLANPKARSDSPAITPDHQRVVFISTATGLVPGVTNTQGDIYVRDVQSGRTYWASTNVASFVGDNYRCFNPVISDNGLVVAFKVKTNSASYGGAPLFVFRHELFTGVTTLLATNALESTRPAISGNGRYVAFEERGNCGWELLHYDSDRQTNELVSVDPTGQPGAGDAMGPFINWDGSQIMFSFRYVPRDSAFCLGGPLTTNLVNDKAQLYLRDMSLGNTLLVSARPDGTPGSYSMENVVPSMTSNGQLIAFDSCDNALVPEDRNHATDVFVYTRTNNSVALVSQRHPTLPSQTSMGLSYFWPNSVSADGRYLLFSALDGNLIPNDTNGLTDIFVRDLLTGSNTLVSVRTNSIGPMIGQVRDPVLSANGRYVAFVHTNGTSGGMPRRSDVYLRDLVHGTTRLLSMSTNGTAANGFSSMPSISGDGHLVTFHSTATDLGPQSLSYGNVFVYDTTTGSNILLSVNTNGTVSGDGISLHPMLSRDGRYVIFQSKATDLTTNTVDTPYFHLYVRDLLQARTRLITPSLTANAKPVCLNPAGNLVLYAVNENSISLYDLITGTNRLICLSCARPAISGDGRVVAFEEKNTLSNISQIALQGLPSGATTLITSDLAHPEKGNGHSVDPVITYDGRYVVFASKASDLVSGDTNLVSDIFLYDRVTQQTIMLSVDPVSGAPGLATSTKPVLASDGRSVLFQTFAANLTQGDYNLSRDIMVLRLSSGDMDEDGLDDNWEMAYFSGLERDGSGDFDADGATDLKEFITGTDPTNQGSVFRVFTLESTATSSVTVLWSAIPGRTYQVQYRTNMSDAPWTDLPGVVTPNGSTGTKTDPEAGGTTQRYYRVLLTD